MKVRDTYKNYKKESKNPVSISVYTKIINEYIKFFIQHILDGYEVGLPSKFGSIRVTGKKQKISFDENGDIKGLTPNWRKTKELWDSDPEAKKIKKLVYNTNENTDGIIYRFQWSKSLSTLRYKSLLSLIIARDTKRSLHKLLIKSEPKEYYTQ